MGNRKKFHEGKQKKSLMSGASRSSSKDSEFLISLKHLDRKQGQTLSHWQEEGILAQALETLRDYCGQSMHAQKGKNFTIYGDFPPS